MRAAATLRPASLRAPRARWGCRRRLASAARACASVPATAAPPATAEAAALKLRLLRAAASSDRGQLHNAYVWGAEAYGEEKRAVAFHVAALEALHAAAPPPPPAAQDGGWELVYASGQLFRSSPFFLAVGEAFNDIATSELFFKLHELQVASFGLSRYGRVAQQVDTQSGVLTSSFTTLLWGLTVIPIIGWDKLLPSFGGRVLSFARLLPPGEDACELRMELERTRVEQAPGVPLMPVVGRFLVDRDAPVGAVWRLLPWNKGRAPVCGLRCTYLDEDTRVVRDRDGAFFVYVRCDDA